MGSSYSDNSLKITSNSGVSKYDAPGFGISCFSGLTPTNTKIIASFDAGRIDVNSVMNVNIPVFTSPSCQNSSVLGGETLTVGEDGEISFMGEKTGKYIENGKWVNFVVATDTENKVAKLYCNKKFVASRETGRIDGIDGINFAFFGSASGQWYVDNLDVKTADNMPSFVEDTKVSLSTLHFDGLNTNEVYSAGGVSYVNFAENAKDVFKMAAKNGLYGKTADDVSLAISNTADEVLLGAFSTGNADERYHALKVSLPNPSLQSGDSVLFETEISADTLNATKAISATAYTSSSASANLGKLIEIDTVGQVEVLGTMLSENGKNVTVIPQKWYSLKIVLKPSTGSGNKMDVYWDGRQLLKDKDFRVNNNSATVFAGISSFEAGYNIRYCPIETSKKLSDGNYSAYKADAMNLDNVMCTVYKNSLPQIGTVSVSSYDPYYFHTIDAQSGKVFTYGQNIKRFIDKLNVTNLADAEFVDGGSSVMLNGDVDDAAYLRLETSDGGYIYIKTETGTDEYLKSLENINADSTWNKDLSGFYEYEQPDISKLKGSALDASFVLDGPAGKYGFVQRDGDKFVCIDNGKKTPIQFWGTNIGGKGAFPDTHDEADMIADSIAAAGFNIVRIHNVDGVSRPNVFGNASSGKRLDDTQMEKLCYLLSALKQRGIYFFIDLTCGRQVYADDGLQDTQYLKNGFKGVCFYDEDIMSILEDYSEMYLSYVNPYTGLALKDDPAMACIDFNNENTLFSFDFDSIRGSKYYTELKSLYNKWLADKYGTRSALSVAWSTTNMGYMTTGLESGEDPANDTVEIIGDGQTVRDGKTVYYTTARQIDELKFIGEVTDKYFAKRTQHLRNLGVKCALTGNTSYGDLQPEVWYANSKTDFVDTHLYWSHRSGGENLLDEGTRFDTNKRFKDAASGTALVNGENGIISSNLTSDGLGFLGQAASLRTYGSPYTISEWKSCPANPYFAEGSLLYAAYGRLQGWNPLEFHFEAQTDFQTRVKNGENVTLSDVFSSVENPVLRAVYPANSIMFLRKDIAEATSGYYYNYTDNAEDRNDIYFVGKTTDGGTVWPGRHLFPELGNYALIGKTGVSFLNESITAENDESIKTKSDAATNGNKVYTSQTGELETDLKNGIFKMNTANSQAICGFAGSKNISAGNLSVRIDNDFAVVTLTTLTNSPIANGERLLLTMAGNAVNYGQLLSEDGTTLKKAGAYPIMAEQITGEVKIKISGDFAVYPLTSSGERKTALDVTKTSDGIKFTVDRSAEAMNFEIVKK